MALTANQIELIAAGYDPSAVISTLVPGQEPQVLVAYWRFAYGPKRFERDSVNDINARRVGDNSP